MNFLVKSFTHMAMCAFINAPNRMFSFRLSVMIAYVCFFPCLFKCCTASSGVMPLELVPIVVEVSVEIYD